MLEGLQDAHDAGVVLEDLGEGRFQMRPRAAQQLTAELLPSLSRQWHQRLAALIHPPEHRVPVMPRGDTVDVEPEEDTPQTLDVVDVEAEVVERILEVAPPRDSGRARAAAHLGAAGEAAAAIEEYLAAVTEVAPVAVSGAVAWGEEARVLIETVMPERTDLMRRVCVELGRMKLIGCSPHGAFSLEAALTDLEAARSLIDDATPAPQRADIHTTMAAALYDRGDAASLEQALSSLTLAMQCLSQSGDPVGAARLLNEQAAVWIRIGDPVRASALLRESRRLFGRLSHPDAAIERAETEHLLARLPFHVPTRSGSKDTAIQRALEHAGDARQGYKQLGMIREVARLDETIGRLEMTRGSLTEARTALQSALTIQGRIGDRAGLARSTSAMGEVMRLSGKTGPALELLKTSIDLNAARGSVVGLQYNRTALADFVGLSGVEMVQAILERAEAMLGTSGSSGVQ